MKIQCKLFVFAMALAVVCLSTTKSYALFGHDVLINQNYDTDTVGQMPSGWSGQRSTNFFATFTGPVSTVNDNAFVTNSVFDSSPNSFAIQGTSAAGTFSNMLLRTVAPFSFSLTNAGKWISYEVDINIDFITGNDGEGWTFRLWNSDFSNLDVGVPRILRNGSQWRFLTQTGGYQGGFNFDQWYNLRVQITPLGFDPAANSGDGSGYGVAHWYIDNSLFYTENYTNRVFARLREIDTFDIRTDIRTPTGIRMFIDNLGVEAIPEPSALAFVVTGAAILMIRRRS